MLIQSTPASSLMQIASILMEIRFFFSSNAMGSKVVQNSYSGLTRLMTMFGT